MRKSPYNYDDYNRGIADNGKGRNRNCFLFCFNSAGLQGDVSPHGARCNVVQRQRISTLSYEEFSFVSRSRLLNQWGGPPIPMKLSCLLAQRFAGLSRVGPQPLI
mmetsp:Transcript_67760/g.119647  ORF Transcript_67760/g.119647 Transcript_67760/m.119647 type:complete len:105 (+) Transcript_67760:258-572(+)